MTPVLIQDIKARYRQDARRMAQIVRAHRKRLGLDQSEVARMLGIRQPHLSKIENGQKQMMPYLWSAICDLWGLPYDCYKLGFLDLKRPTELRDCFEVGKYHIPKRYAYNQGSTMRIFRLFRDYGVTQLGQANVEWFIQQKGIDPDYCVHADHQFNYRFLLDFMGYLGKSTPIMADIPALVGPVSSRAVHGQLANIYDQQIHDGVSALQTLCHHAGSYDLNHEYKVETLGKSYLTLSVRPAKHLDKFKQISEETGAGHYLCDYRGAFLSRFSAYGSIERPPMKVTHPREHCIFSGADRCIHFAHETH